VSPGGGSPASGAPERPDEPTLARSQRTGLFAMPVALARELVGYAICQGSLRHDFARMFAAVMATACDIPVRSVALRESRRERHRSAVIVVAADDAAAFARIFPDALRLDEPAPEEAAFRLAGERPCRARRKRPS